MSEINIGGKLRPIKVGLNQSIEYCELRDVSISAMNDDLQAIAKGNGSGAEIRDLIWSALKDGARGAKKEFKYTNYDVGDWIEDMSETEMVNFMSALTNSLPNTKAESKKKAQ